MPELETVVDPGAAALHNELTDDEPQIEEEQQAVAEAREWLHAGNGVPHADAMRGLGLN
jgi:hypothetical protein